MITEHGGRIWAESEGLHKGSAFIFALPLGGKAPKAEKRQEQKTEQPDDTTRAGVGQDLADRASS